MKKSTPSQTQTNTGRTCGVSDLGLVQVIQDRLFRTPKPTLDDLAQEHGQKRQPLKFELDALWGVIRQAQSV